MRVTAQDPRLARSVKATIVDRRVTKYAGTDDLEHAAETIAAVATGKVPEFAEAGAVGALPDGGPENLATGYRPDQAAQLAATDFIGAQAGSYPAEFDDLPTVHVDVMSPDEDPFLAELMVLARSRRFPRRQKEMIAILAGVAEHGHEKPKRYRGRHAA